MIDLRQHNDTFISHLRVKSSGLDPLSALLSISSLLGAAELDHSELGRSAILFIRRLVDPLPGALKLGQHIARLPPEWERSVAARIGEFSRNAARPILENVAANAEAVLFVDRAELLACLALDWLEGNLMTRWWWQGLLRDDDVSRTAVSLWLETPEFVPAAMHHLALRGKAVPFLRYLSDSDVRASLQSLLQTFGLNELREMLDKNAIMDRADGDFSMDGTQPERTPSQSSDRSRPFLQESSLIAPWQGWVREVNGNGLDVDRQTLLGLGLMLQRAPEVVRLKSFARNIVAWRGSALALHSSVGGLARSSEKSYSEKVISPQTDPLDTGAQMANEGSNPIGPGVASVETEGGFPQEVRADGQPHSITSDLWILQKEALRKDLIERVGKNDADVANSSAGSVSVRRSAVSSDEGVFASEDLPAGVVEQTTVRQESANMIGLLGDEIETKFGGVFYLINLGLLLGLYGDFTSPTRPGISLSIWDFLALVGRSLAGKKIMGDPIWPLLADLAGRHVDDPPGRGFRPSSSWRVPPHWLDAFPEQATCRWIADGRRLRVRHPAGFLIIDVPVRSVNILQQLETELAPFRLLHRIRVRRGSYKQAPEEVGRVLQWLSRFAPYAQARLQRGLGVTRRRDVRRLVCLHQARIVVTPTRVDVEFSLERLPVQVRLGGMDRDPGWVPSAGRFVSFQYK